MSENQYLFNERYSEEENIDIVGDERLRLRGSLKIKDFARLKRINLKKFELNDLEISSCPQLTEIELSELSKLTSLSVTECSNLTELCCLSNKLTSLEISGCYILKEIDLSKLPKLTNLSVTDCRQLTRLNCSSIKTLTELKVSGLIELDCSNTSIEKLSLYFCPNIEKLNCSNNNKLINLDVSNCFNLKSIDCSNCSNSKFTSLNLSYYLENIDIILPSNLVISRENERKIKNILIVGHTGSGRSTLANVLSDSDYFRESEYTVSETKVINKKVFDWNEVKYCVFDTIGFGDTGPTSGHVWDDIKEEIYSIPNGISQILFAVDGRFIDEKIAVMFNIIKDFTLEVAPDYITIVITNFNKFRSKEECQSCKKNMPEKIAKLCNDVIFVNNPPINFKEGNDDDDNDDYITQIKINKNTRKMSRKILLDYLENVRPVKKNEYLKLRTWSDPDKPSKEHCLIL